MDLCLLSYLGSFFWEALVRHRSLVNLPLVYRWSLATLTGIRSCLISAICCGCHFLIEFLRSWQKHNLVTDQIKFEIGRSRWRIDRLSLLELDVSLSALAKHILVMLRRVCIVCLLLGVALRFRILWCKTTIRILIGWDFLICFSWWIFLERQSLRRRLHFWIFVELNRFIHLQLSCYILQFFDFCVYFRLDHRLDFLFAHDVKLVKNELNRLFHAHYNFTIY